MPTYQWLARFARDFDSLTPAEQRLFLNAVTQFVEDLRAGNGLRKGLRVKGVQGTPGVFEMTWAHDGRATFHFGQPLGQGGPHVVWRRIASHSIFSQP
jgi:hypothetical protein